MNKIEYKEIIAFHPGYYIKDTINELELTQGEFAERLGITGKTLSKLVNGQAKITAEVAKKLSMMLGTTVDTWLNLQQTYDQKCIEIEYKMRLDEELELLDMIDYKYFVDLGVVAQTRDKEEKLKNLCSYFRVSCLACFLEEDFLVNYRTSGSHTLSEKKQLNSKIWLQTAINFGALKEVSSFNANKLKMHLAEIRGMITQEPEPFIPRLQEIFQSCGVSFVLLPSLKNANVHGAVKWINKNKVVLALSDRKKDADTFWFSLFHEIKHVLQQKIKLAITSDIENSQLEEEADSFAREQLSKLF